ncbi:hypothetical protein CHRY9293_00721 [Chryseobacterium potabilaquae]|uniref:Uncharacterized protein n=1 Tax=Chryseobacterium potabilaquae TaxID=2675057 RepID=A0A6N4X833_9FLAO|nr:hypothetical protein CHRY9293_00721 [Chryseobacterium potabilaquae]
MHLFVNQMDEQIVVINFQYSLALHFLSQYEEYLYGDYHQNTETTPHPSL